MMRLLSALLLLAALTAATSPCRAESPLKRQLSTAQRQADGYDFYTVSTRFADGMLDPVEGVWQMTADDGVFAIKANRLTGVYEIRAVDMPDRSVDPGTLIGVAGLTARKATFDCWMLTRHSLTGMTTPKRFTLKFSDDGRLVISPAGKSVKFNLWRMLPYMFRYSVSVRDNREANLDGALRIFPAPAVPYEGLIYL